MCIFATALHRKFNLTDREPARGSAWSAERSSASSLEGVIYAWHRSAHTFGVLWRGFHQMHHGPQRVDIFGSLVFHPTEIVVQTLLQLAVTVIVLGLDPLAAALTGYFIAASSFFQHWNVRTPQWIGYLIQRPEQQIQDLAGG